MARSNPGRLRLADQYGGLRRTHLLKQGDHALSFYAPEAPLDPPAKGGKEGEGSPRAELPPEASEASEV